MSECIKHTFDWSWWRDSNTVSNAKAEPKKKFADILVKK